MAITMTVEGITFITGDTVTTPHGRGTIIDLDRVHGLVGVRMEDGKVKWCSWRDVEL